MAGENGYIKFFRSVEGSEDFIGLRPDQCWVAIRIAQLANFKPGFMRFRTQAIPVGRGEVGHTIETIAKRTGSTRKVVRTTIDHLVRSGFLGTRTGTVAGTTYRILIVRNYERFQGDDDEVGPVTGMAAGHDRATTGPRPGHDRAPRERREEGKKDLLLAPRADASEPASPAAGPLEADTLPATASAAAALVKAAAPIADLLPDPVVAVLPCVGSGPKEFAVTESRVNALRAAYPGVDVALEIRRARLWLDDNPQKRKTASGAPRFLTSWMARQQNAGRGLTEAPRNQPALRRL